MSKPDLKKNSERSPKAQGACKKSNLIVLLLCDMVDILDAP